MFDDHRINIKHPEKIIHEHNHATTDESIKIALELEQQIQKEITKKLLCEANSIKFTAVIRQDILMNTLFMRLDINGTFYQIDKRMDYYSMENLQKTIHDWICSCISYDCFHKVALDLHVSCMNGYGRIEK